MGDGAHSRERPGKRLWRAWIWCIMIRIRWVTLVGLFQNEQELQRLAGLRSLEDRRLQFADEMRRQGICFSRVLLAQAGGGFMGLALSEGRVFLLGGPTPGDELPFTIEDVTNCRISFVPHSIPSEGMAGLLGMGGKRGGRGYLLVIESGENRREIEVLAGHQCVYTLEKGELPLLNPDRRKRDANFVWDFRPIDVRELNRLVEAWSALV